MKMRVITTMALFAAGIIGALAQQPARASEFPNRTVTIVVPFPAGGSADFIPRLLAEKLREIWKQPVIVENRPGAAGSTGSAYVANAEPDGYTLLSSPAGPLAINKFVQSSIAFEPANLEPIAVIAEVPTTLSVRANFPANTAQEFIAYAKSHPGKLNYASQGPGSTSHLTAILFENMTGTQMVHVPYRGTNPAQADLIAGNVDLMFDNLGSAINHHRSGKIKLLALTSEKRGSEVPEIPTLEEEGLKGFRSSTWFALAAPPKTPPVIVEGINKTVKEILRMPDVRKRYQEIGLTVVGNSPQEARAFIASEAKYWGELIERANIPKQ